MTPRQELASLRAQELAEVAVRRQRIVKPLDGIAVPFDTTFVAHVGQQATKVWVVLLGARGADGYTQATLEGIQRIIANVPWKTAEEKRVTLHQVRRALTRLKELKLVRDAGWQLTDVAHPKAKKDPVLGTVKEVYRRLIVGNVRQQPGVVEVLLPTETVVGVEKATTRGGARKGSGRPRKGVSEAPPTARFEIEKIKPRARFEIESEPVRTRARIKPRGIIRLSSPTEVVLLPSEEERGAERRPLFSGEPETAMDELLGEVDGGGRELLGGGSPAQVSMVAWSMLPPFPGVGVVEPPTVPAPPMVQAEQSEEDRVTLLLSAYDMALRQHLPREFNPHNGKKPTAAERKLLLEASRNLLDHKVSPLRWVEFSLDGWKALGKAEDTPVKNWKPRPMLRWVYAPKRIEEKAGWARSAYERRGGTAVLTRTMRQFVARWNTMMQAVLRGEVSPDAAGEKFFPNGQYDRLVEKAVTEGRQLQEKIDTDIRAGIYLW